jgi:hypothetical protein
MKTRVETKHEPPARDADGRRAEAEAALQRCTNLLDSVEGIVWEADASTFRDVGMPVRKNGVVAWFVSALTDISGRFNSVV